MGRSRGELLDLPDEDVELLFADDALEQSRHTCGFHYTDCSDPEHEFWPQREVCNADMVRAAAERRWDDLHEAAPFHDGRFKLWTEKATALTPYHYRDGVTIIVTDDAPSPVDFLDGPLTRKPDESGGEPISPPGESASSST